MAVFDVIAWEDGDNQTFVWKYPGEDFNTASQLIVHESQEAVLFKDGQALDLFGPGRYTLQTENIPLLNNIVNLPTGGQSAFHCEVWFVNKVEQMAIAWGTNSRIQYMEPTFGFPLSVGASGEMALSVSDSRKLLVKLVGTQAILSREALTSYFRAFLQMRIKSHFVKAIQSRKLSIFELDAHLVELSGEIKELLRVDFDEYGVDLRQFMVTAVARPEDDPTYRRFKDIFFSQYADVREAEIRQQVQVIDQQTEAKKTVIEAQALAEKRQTEGFTYQQERGFDVAEQMAQNEAVGEFTNLGIGMGMVSGVGTPVAGMVGGVMQDALGAGAEAVAGQTTSGAAGGVASVAGAGVAAGTSGAAGAAGAQHSDPVAVLSQLKQLLDAGLIPQEAYDAKVTEVLGRM